MGLNDLRLPPALISALYPQSLVSIEQDEILAPVESKKTEVPASLAVEPKLKYLGDNKKNILVVVNYTDAVHLPDGSLAFLSNMLGACSLSLVDVAIINKNNFKDQQYPELVTRFNSRIIFLFGIDPQTFGLPVNFPHYQVQKLANATFLYAPDLEALKEDAGEKRKLWAGLKTIFGI